MYELTMQTLSVDLRASCHKIQVHYSANKWFMIYTSANDKTSIQYLVLWYQSLKIEK